MRFRAQTLAVILFATIMSSVPGCKPQRVSVSDVDNLPSSPPALSVSYGPDPIQTGDLRLPPGKGPFPVVVVIHGGCWTKGFATRRNTAALASFLTEHGYATWNIEYRQLGEPGAGWPGTFLDWANATDYLRVLAKTQPLRLDNVSTIGHSAGAYAALWLASRARLAPSSEIRGGDPLPVASAIALDGPANLTESRLKDDSYCGVEAVAPLMGGTPEAVPQRYAQADIDTRLPLRARQTMFAAVFTTPAEAEPYVKKALAAGDDITLVPVHDSGHFEVIAPTSKVFREQVEKPLLKALPAGKE